MATSICPVCGEPFDKSMKAKTYCSAKCRAKAQYFMKSTKHKLGKNIELREPRKDCFAYTDSECLIMKKGHFPCKMGECSFYKDGRYYEFKEVFDE